MSTGGSRSISRYEALHHHKRWTDNDRKIAEAEIDRLAPTEFRVQDSGGSVMLMRDSRTIAWLNAGRIAYLNRSVAHPDARAHPESGGDFYHLRLSRFVESGPHSRARVIEESICPTCDLALPATGVCDDCA